MHKPTTTQRKHTPNSPTTIKKTLKLNSGNRKQRKRGTTQTNNPNTNMADMRQAGTEQVSSPASGDGVAPNQDDESKPLDEEEKRLYQRITAKLNCLAHDRLDLKYATSCLASAASSPGIGDTRAAKRVGRYLRKAPVAWQGFSFHDPRPEELLCYMDADWASDKTSRLGGRRVEVS